MPSPPCEIDDDPARLDRGAIWAFLSTEAYWARWRTRDDLHRQIDASWRVVGAYVDDAQVGFARAVSDGVALAYLADVYVLSEHRGRGIAQAIVAAMIDDEAGRRMRWLLHTDDAHDLYRKFGFDRPGATLLERPAQISAT